MFLVSVGVGEVDRRLYWVVRVLGFVKVVLREIVGFLLGECWFRRGVLDGCVLCAFCDDAKGFVLVDL